ncbi:uncharacterized protein LOC118756301 [Rhagoletis pomonella]|uniref:uncharacterized protein LOC118756301 n=1 Tax=Rhagoletis pomonella TaxID=28610 RepID=UPI00177EB2A8|nr:uncharacterized protein LOC118756301 [Rhagoletis pomonella]
MLPGAEGATGDDAVKVISLYKKRTLSLKKQLDDINQQLSPDSLRSLDEVDIAMYLELVERLRTSFDEAQSCLEAEDHSELASEASWSFARLHMEVKGKLTRELNHRRADVAHSSTARPFVIDDASPSFIISQRNRLPELQIQYFSGEYTEWPDFIAMFNSVINNCAELSKIEKFQHLRANLRGAALDTVRSLEPSDTNYDKALDLLKKRFGNRLLNFQAHIKEIFALKKVESGCASGLRSFSDKLNAHLRSLQTMATGEQIADGFLIYLISQKLDTKSQIKWEEDLPINSLPTWTSVATFLKKRCRMLENVEATVPAASSTSVAGKRSPHGNSSSRKALVTSSSLCSFCGSTSHWIYGCSQFGDLSPASRYKEAKRLQLCLNCLRQGHTLNKCKSGHCRQCTSKHHSLLHMHKGEQPTSLRSADNTGAETAPTSSMRVQQVATAASSENFVLLATAIIHIRNRTGCYVPCSELLDSASQVNFVTWRLVNQLKLETKKISTSISGIGASNFVANRAVDIFARARSDDYTFPFEAIVANTITDHQPNFDLNIDSWNIPPNAKLADPLFYKSQRIDVLLGASIFFELMCVGQIKLAKNLPILQKTRLGWSLLMEDYISTNHRL